MLRHKFSIGPNAPHSIDAVIEIPQTDAMSVKTEINFGTGELLDAGKVDPPIPIYWHYGAVPETLGDEGEPVDIILVGDQLDRKTGDQVKVRPIGVYRVVDGWHTNDDKIIVVPDTPEFQNIFEVSDLPLVKTSHGEKPFPELLEEFLGRYRKEDEVVHDGWGTKEDALNVLRTAIDRYKNAPLAKLKEDQNTFSLDRHIFIPPPPAQLMDQDIDIPLDELLNGNIYDEEFGYLVSRQQVRLILEAMGLRGKNAGNFYRIDREKLIQEKLNIAKTLMGYGVKVFTASNDVDWLERAEQIGVLCDYVRAEQYNVENVPSLSSQDAYTIHFRRADGVHIALGRQGEKGSIKSSLIQAHVIQEQDECVELLIPRGLIPFGLPMNEKLTMLVDWTDSGFNIWPDRDNKPHLVISDAIVKIAQKNHKLADFAHFLEQARPHFQGIHFVERAQGNTYGSPTNSIDVGMAIIVSSALSEKSRLKMQKILGRPIDNSLDLSEHRRRAEAGLRCCVLPLDRAIHSLLREGDLIAHVAADQSASEETSFFNMFGRLHEMFSQAVLRRRSLFGSPFALDRVTEKLQNRRALDHDLE